MLISPYAFLFYEPIFTGDRMTSDSEYHKCVVNQLSGVTPGWVMCYFCHSRFNMCLHHSFP
jgi:hypothetical protein